MTTRSVQETNKIFEDYASWRGEPTTSTTKGASKTEPARVLFIFGKDWALPTHLIHAAKSS